MKQWEYKRICYFNDEVTEGFDGWYGKLSLGKIKRGKWEGESLEQVFSRLGSEGWELVSVTRIASTSKDHFYFFKRPIDN